jgi:hypothetical protein
LVGQTIDQIKNVAYLKSNVAPSSIPLTEYSTYTFMADTKDPEMKIK